VDVVEDAEHERDSTTLTSARRSERLQVVSADTSEGTIRVLLADDDEGYLEHLRSLIESQRELSVVGTATNGLAAIELVDELAPDAAVLDLHMPLLDGVSACARLRRDHPSLCLVAITGDDAPALHRAARESGADDVLLKSQLVDGLVDRLTAARATA
jgi:DNA-binding NarL/FixJ family response regulator